MNRQMLEDAKELARREWSEGAEIYLALGCFFWLIIVSIGGLVAIAWGIVRVLETL